MQFEDFKKILIDKYGEEVIVKENIALAQPQLTIAADKIIAVCFELRDNENTFFDYLTCLSGLDNGPEKGTMEVIYHLYSIPFNHHLVLKVELSREDPKVETASGVWRSADWHEREAYDMFGIVFEHHPDLRRILLPADWQGFPLRKDYQEQELYHGIKVKY